MHVARQAPKTTDKGEIKLSELQQTVLQELLRFVCKHRAWHLPSNPEHCAFWKKPPASLEHVPKTSFNELALKQLIISVTATSLPGCLRIKGGNDLRFFHESSNHANIGHLFPSRKGLELITPKDTTESENLIWAKKEAARLEFLLTLPINRQYIKCTSVPDPARERAKEIAQQLARREQAPDPTIQFKHFIDALHEQRERKTTQPKLAPETNGAKRLEATLVMPRLTKA